MTAIPRPRAILFCPCGDHAFVKTSRYGVALVSVPDASHLTTHALTLREPGKKIRGRAYAASGVGYLHTLITGWSRVDHQDGNGLDCRRTNMRPASRAQNARNVFRHADARGRFKGVYQLPSGRWNAKLSIDGTRINVGTFDTDVAAAVAYDAAALIHFGEFARLNFPKNVGGRR